jgi:cell shape-determining protein MreD
MNRYLKYLILIILAPIIVWVQISAVGFWPYHLDHLNLLLLVPLIFLFFSDFWTVLFLSLLIGVMADIFSFDFFGVYTASLLIVMILSDFLLDVWFINRSAYSFLALAVLADLAYNFILYSLFYLTSFFSDRIFFLWSGDFWAGLGWELLGTLLVIFLFFGLMNFTTTKLKPIFLEKR